jgi:hypothetical protein
LLNRVDSYKIEKSPPAVATGRQKELIMMHSHNFVENYQGLVGFGRDRENNENTVIYYLQKFSDDQVMETIIKRMRDSELEEFFDLINRALVRYLADEEYHRIFLKDGCRQNSGRNPSC